MNNVLRVTTQELENVLLGLNDSIGSFINLTTMTNPKMKKTGNPYNEVTKLSSYGSLVSTRYESGVLNQLNNEGKAESDYKKGANTMPLDFSTSNNNFVGGFTNKAGQFQGMVLTHRPHENSKPETRYFADGVEVPKSAIANWLPTVSKPTNQGTAKQIFWRKVYITNIVEITVNGTRYITTDI